MNKGILVLILSLTGSYLFAQYPGNVSSGIRFWVKANNGPSCTVNGCAVSQWNDQSGSNDHLAQASTFRQPQFAENVSNFNPGLALNGSSDRMRRNVANYTTDFTIFIAARVDISITSPQGTIFNNRFNNGSGNGDQTSFQIDTDGTTYRYRNNQQILYGPYVDEYVILSATNTDNGIGAGLTRVDAYRNELLVGSLNYAGTNRAQTFRDYVIGVNRINSNYMAGEISEIVLYDRVLSAVEINRVESYLAVKYGLTLGINGTTLDYNSSDSTIIWDQSVNTGYNYAIGGIGRDDDSELNQKQSQSIYDSLVTIGNGANLFLTNALNTNTFTADVSYLLWGNDNGALGFSCNTNVPTGYGLLYGRIWKVQETGTVGNVIVAFDTTNTGLTANPSAYALVIDTDNDSNYDDEVPIIGSIVGSNLAFTGVDFLDGNTFTLIQVDDYRFDTVNVSICDDTTYTLPNGGIVAMSGTYIDTLVIPGCDSVITTNLTVYLPDTFTVDTSICDGTLYAVGGSTYSVSGTYFDLVGATVFGCDSIVRTNLTVIPPDTFTVDTSICIGTTYTVGGSTYSTSGTYFDLVGLTFQGCDSVVRTNLSILPADTFRIDTSICIGTTYTIGGSTYSTTGTYFDLVGLTFQGCDSFVRTNLIMLPADTLTIDTSICNGTTYSVGGSIYSTSGTYYDLVGTTILGCDSIVRTNLTILPYDTATVDTNICGGTTYSVGGSTYSTSGTYYDLVGTTVLGCDSFVQTNLTVTPLPTVSLNGSDTLDLCEGESVILDAGNPGLVYDWSTNESGQRINVTTSGTYSVTVSYPFGCAASDTVVVNFVALPEVDLGPDTLVCDQAFFALDADPLGQYGASGFNWSNGENGAAILVSDAGTYSVTVAQGPGCTGGDTIVIDFGITPIVELGQDTSICGEEELILNADPLGLYAGAQFNWSTGQIVPEIAITSSGIYRVSVITECGVAEDSVAIEIKESFGPFLPNAFSPNGDGLNDLFWPVSAQAAGFNLKMFDRWGKVIFESNSPGQGWDGTYAGKAVPEGVYVYILRVSDCFGELHDMRGSVTLFR